MSNYPKTNAKLRRYFAKHGSDETFDKMFNKDLMKKFHRQRPARPIKPLIQEERCYIREYDGCDADKIFYGFAVLDDENMTDEEIRKELYDNMEVRICSPYDCTGQWFTRWIDFHRNPNGMISYVHNMGLDV